MARKRDHDARSAPAVPGTPSGMESIVERAFGVPTKPTLNRDEVRARVEQALAQQNIAYEALYVSESPTRRGGLFNARGRRVPFPEGAAYDRCFVALVDPDERARWAHPAYFAFVPADGRGAVALVDTNLPPHARGLVRLVPASRADPE